MLGYLQHRLSLDELTDSGVKYSNEMNGLYEDDRVNLSRDALAQFGIADVKTFRLEWKDWEAIMESLGL